MIVEQKVYDHPKASAAFVAKVLREAGRERGARGPIAVVFSDGWEISVSRSIAAKATPAFVKRLRLGAKPRSTTRPVVRKARRHVAR